MEVERERSIIFEFPSRMSGQPAADDDFDSANDSITANYSAAASGPCFQFLSKMRTFDIRTADPPAGAYPAAIWKNRIARSITIASADFFYVHGLRIGLQNSDIGAADAERT